MSRAEDVMKRVREVIERGVEAGHLFAKADTRGAIAKAVEGDAVYAELRALVGEMERERDAAKACALKYLGWLGVGTPAAAALEADMRNPEMVGAIAMQEGANVPDR